MARVFKRGDSWCLDYIYQGKRHRPKIGAKRKAEAALAEIRAKIAAGDFVAPLTVGRNAWRRLRC